MRRGRSSALANPVLVGAVTLLIVNVATVLAWVANRGLPFVPTHEVKIELPNGANLLPGNEVRGGGFRIGIVSDMDAVMLPGDQGVGAVATLKIDAKQKDIPIDSRVIIRPRSVLGLKYVELQRGDSETLLREGDTLPASRASIPVELDEFQNIFDENTREGVRKNLGGFGVAFAGRGASLNRAITEAPRFLEHLQPVMTVLAAPETNIAALLQRALRLHPHRRTRGRSLRARLHRRRRYVRGLVALPGAAGRHDRAFRAHDGRRDLVAAHPAPVPRVPARHVRRARGRGTRAAAHAAAHHPGAARRHPRAAALARRSTTSCATPSVRWSGCSCRPAPASPCAGSATRRTS